MAMQHFLQEALASMQALGGAATSALRIAGIVVAAWLLIIVAQRAIRTRLGRPVSTRPKYCIASETTIQDLAVQLLAHARESPPRNDTDASVLIFSMLARYHPCT